jgi:hypothetical protein
MKKVLIFLAIVCFGIQSCQKKGEENKDNKANAKVSLEIVRMDSLLFGQKNVSSVEAILAENPAYFKPYFDISGTNISELSAKLTQYRNSPELLDFYKEIIYKRVDLQKLSQDLSVALSNVKTFDPSFRIPKVYYSFTGFAGKDLVVNDSTIVIGLEYFGGKASKYLPQVYDYQLYKYQQATLVPYILNFIGAKYVRMNETDKSFLADAVFYGKGYEFTQTMAPNTPDSLVVGIEGNRLAQTEASAEAVWKHVVENKLLYEKNEFKKSKYLDERPSVPEIATECPGMVGRWLGWKIVKKYTEKTDTSLKDLLQNPNAQEIFTKSEYAGK